MIKRIPGRNEGREEGGCGGGTEQLSSYAEVKVVIYLFIYSWAVYQSNHFLNPGV